MSTARHALWAHKIWEVNFSNLKSSMNLLPPVLFPTMRSYHVGLQANAVQLAVVIHIVEHSWVYILESMNLNFIRSNKHTQLCSSIWSTAAALNTFFLI